MTETAQKPNRIQVNGIPEEVYREAKKHAVDLDMTVGQYIALAIQEKNAMQRAGKQAKQ